MKKIIIYILAIIPLLLNAQTLSIEQLWEKLTVTNHAQQQQLAVRVANQSLIIEQLNRYPVVYADANLQRNLIIPTTPVPAIAFDPLAQEGAITPLKFATKWNAKGGLQAEWKFFDPNRKPSLDEKQILLKKAQIQQKENAQNLKKEATLAYTSIVLATLQYQSAIQDTVLYKEILQIVQSRFQAGRETMEQYNSAEQEYERKKIQLYETYSVLCESNLELQKYIDLNDIIQLTSAIEDIKNALQGYENINYEIQLNTINIQLNENDFTALKKQLLPSMTFNAYYGAQYFSSDFRLFEQNKWFGNSYANIALRIPLSAYIVQNPTLEKLRYQREQNQLELDETNRLDIIKRNQQKAKISAAEQKVKSIKKIVLLSKENLDKQKISYENGRILVSEYNRSLSNHSSNLQELWQAEYDLINIYLYK